VTGFIVGERVVGTEGVPVTASLEAISLIKQISKVMDVHGASKVGAEVDARDVGTDGDGGQRVLTEPNGTADTTPRQSTVVGTDETAGGSEGGLTGSVSGGVVVGEVGNADDTTSKTSTVQSAGTVARISVGMDNQTETDGRVEGTLLVGGSHADLLNGEGLRLADDTGGRISVPVTEATSTVAREGVNARAAKGSAAGTDPVSTESLVSSIKGITCSQGDHISKLKGSCASEWGRGQRDENHVQKEIKPK
jgi:hypothetical protein